MTFTLSAGRRRYRRKGGFSDRFPYSQLNDGLPPNRRGKLPQPRFRRSSTETINYEAEGARKWTATPTRLFCLTAAANALSVHQTSFLVRVYLSPEPAPTVTRMFASTHRKSVAADACPVPLEESAETGL